jgi:FAD/FMN-containing dehydrogenase
VGGFHGEGCLPDSARACQSYDPVGRDEITHALHRRRPADELGDDQWELQRQITRVFDPQGILNPGKVFAP